MLTMLRRHHDVTLPDGTDRWNLAPRLSEYREIKTNDPVEYVLSMNLHRRHLITGQASMAAAKSGVLKEKYAREAEERMKSGKGVDGSGGRGHKKNPGANWPQGLPAERGPRTTEKLGERLGVSGKSVERAQHVLADGIPGLVEVVEHGQIAVSGQEHLDLSRRVAARSVGKRVKQKTEN
jgi:hypothetical protein